MVTGIIGLLSLILGFAIWAIKRKSAEDDSPETKHENAISNADAAIAAGPNGITQVNVSVEEAVHRGSTTTRAGTASTGLRNEAQAGGDSGGPGNPIRVPGIDELNRRLPGAAGPNA